jgi:DNA-binding response OmpR family regulator
MSGAGIVVVEDDDAIGRALVGTLTAQGFATEWAHDGTSAVDVVEATRPGLVLLDLGLPDLDGIEVCRRLRALDPALRIVILTARHDEVDVVLGLDAGADDYVTKPFRLAELLARVRAHLRRSETPEADQLVVGDVEIDTAARRVRVEGREIDLRAREFELLVFLARHAGSAVTRERIMTEVWDEHWFGSTKTLDMHISALRRKFGENVGTDDSPSRITTLRGVGYRFEMP